MGGSYEPLAAEAGICAYKRGNDVLVAVAVDPAASFEPGAGFVDALGADLGADVGVWLLERG